jgi:excisionase family DNA binding protein
MSLADVSSLEEAAEYLRVKPTTLAALARAGKIGSLKSGRTLTFPRDCVEAYIAANTSAAVTANPHGLTDRSLSRVKGRA